MVPGRMGQVGTLTLSSFWGCKRMMLVVEWDGRMKFTISAKALGVFGSLFAAVTTPAHADDIVIGSAAAAVPAARSVGDAPLVIGDEDAEYRQLMAQWKNIEKRQAGLAVTPRISVPSGMPLAVARMSSDYGMREHPVLGGRRAHQGVDLAAASGTPVYATADGVVDTAEYSSSYGNLIKVDHGAQLETRFAHLSRMVVGAGQKVRKGDLIGYVGSTGRSTGPHLHYEVRVSGQAVNPMPYMAQSQAQQDFALSKVRGGIGGE